MRLLPILLLLALAGACSSTRIEAGSDGEVHAYANTSVVLVQYEGGLHARLVDSSGRVLEERRLDGAGEKAWRRTGLLSFRWTAIEPSEAKRLLGIEPDPPPNLAPPANP